MEIDKNCLDCEFGLWGSKNENEGVCLWMFPFPLPPWLKGIDILQVHGYNIKRKIFKDRPFVKCPAWKEIEVNEEQEKREQTGKKDPGSPERKA